MNVAARLCALVTPLLMLFATAAWAEPQWLSFTYQGRLDTHDGSASYRSSGLFDNRRG